MSDRVEMTDEQKKEEYAKFVKDLREKMGIDKIEDAVNKLLAWYKPGTESAPKPQNQMSDKITDAEKKKLTEAQDTLDFLDQIGGLLQKYGVIEGAPNDPYMKWMFMMAQQHQDLLSWQMRENYKEWDKMKRDKDHKT